MASQTTTDVTARIATSKQAERRRRASDARNENVQRERVMAMTTNGSCVVA
jgi:hypothetical protein